MKEAAAAWLIMQNFQPKLGQSPGVAWLEPLCRLLDGGNTTAHSCLDVACGGTEKFLRAEEVGVGEDWGATSGGD